MHELKLPRPHQQQRPTPSMRAQGALPKPPGAGGRTATKAATLLCSVLLVAPSSAYAATLLSLPNNLATRTTAAEATLGRGGRLHGAQGQFTTHGGSGAGADCPLLQAGSRGRLFRAVTTLRGGSPAMSVPGFSAAAEALGSVSMPTAAALTTGPALFVQGLLLSMIMSIGGFRVREHFVTYGYGFSVALQVAGAAWIFRDGLHMLSMLHVAGVVAYGLRLVLFCSWRDTLSSFQNRRKRLLKPATTKKGRPYNFWGIVSMLYALLALPSVYALRRLPPAQGWVGVSQAGLAIMAAGLLIEGVADLQKSHFKEKTPDTFCSSGLYRLSRHPNYFGEALFWGGVWLAATPSFSKWYHWVFATLGPTQIVSVILRATSGLEMRQAEKYGASKEWEDYAASTPVFVPGTRQYAWGKGKGDKKKDNK